MKRAFLILLFICALAALLAVHGFAAEPDPTEPTEPEPIEVIEAEDGELHLAYIHGTANGLFLPQATMTRAEFAQMIWNLQSDPAAGVSVFSDVQSGAWYAPAVNSLAEMKVLGGYADGTFRPMNSVTRAEYVRILAVLSGRQPNESCYYTDVSYDHWAYNEICLAAQCGWMKGYEDYSFHPDAPITRAEAVTALNRYLGRIPDETSINVILSASLFPDVPMGSWYYYNVMEAALDHTAACTERSEIIGALPHSKTELKDGFHVLNGKLYLIIDGYFVTQEGDGVYNGVTYHCAGESGVCTADGSSITLWDGEICLLYDGTIAKKAGLFELDGDLYYRRADGSLLTNGTWNSMRFDAEGKYTSGSRAIDSYVRDIIDEVTTAGMTQREKLRACYDYIYYHMEYQANNDHPALGADASLWTEQSMLRLIDRGKGNCYCFASEMYYLARQLGYYQAHAISGRFGGLLRDHAWVELPIDGVNYILDPEVDSKYFPEGPGQLFLVRYSEAPFSYWK